MAGARPPWLPPFLTHASRSFVLQFGGFLDASDSDPVGTHSFFVNKLLEAGPPAYIHFVEPRTAGNSDVDPGSKSLAPFRSLCMGKTAFIAAGGYTPETAKEALRAGHADAVAFGRWFLSNPDLPRRVREGLDLNPYDRATFYTQDPVVGYTDYKFHD